MKPTLVVAAALLLGACGAADQEADPRCAELTETWSCPKAYGEWRARCVDGEYKEERCSAETWCLVARSDAASPYEGTCAPRSWRAGGCETDSTVCAEGWYCWRNACYLDCRSDRDACKIEGEICISEAPAPAPPICTTAEDRQ
jgi:hypothetical protein